MSGKSKLIYLLLVLIFAFTILAAGAVISVDLAAQSDSSHLVYHVNQSSPSFIIAGDCDLSPGCNGGGG